MDNNRGCIVTGGILLAIAVGFGSGALTRITVNSLSGSPGMAAVVVAFVVLLGLYAFRSIRRLGLLGRRRSPVTHFSYAPQEKKKKAAPPIEEAAENSETPDEISPSSVPPPSSSPSPPEQAPED